LAKFDLISQRFAPAKDVFTGPAVPREAKVRRLRPMN
jgi:hypothetical protein